MNYTKKNKLAEMIGKNWLQFFAEPDNGGQGGSGGEPQTQPKTYSEQEYLTLKNRIDEMSKNEKKLKEQLASNMTEEQKKAQEREEVDKKLAEYESKFEDYSLKEELLKGGIFTNEEIDTIIKEKNDKSKLLNSVVTLVKSKIEEAKKQAVADFMKTSDVSGKGTTKEEDLAKKEIEELAKMGVKKTQTSKFF